MTGYLNVIIARRCPNSFWRHCSSDAMHLKHNHVNAFACPYNESCYCIVNEDHHKVVDCTVCGESPDISNDYWYWFNDVQGMYTNGLYL